MSGNKKVIKAYIRDNFIMKSGKSWESDSKMKNFIKKIILKDSRGT